MKLFDANISNIAVDFLKDCLENTMSFENANHKLLETSGIEHFFPSDNDYRSLINSISKQNNNLILDPDRTAYGDFQTNPNLAQNAVKLFSELNFSPEIVIEPTCGKGNFIIAALSNFDSIKHVIGIEIYEPYVWETKFNILHFYINNPCDIKPQITIYHSSVFDFDFKQISKQFRSEKLLIIGNPPWVTSAKLTNLNSLNLPKKSNLKNQRGIDAITGKGNFDIAEFITISLLEAFQSHNAYLCFLVKNSVIKNLIFEQKSKKFKIENIEKYAIDSKKEFGASVESSVLICRLNANPSYECDSYDFYSKDFQYKFGWVESKFVSNITTYFKTKEIDNICPFIWRQGIKHDAATIMELERRNGHFINNRKDEISIEEDLIYGFLKSSDLKNTVILATRKHTIVTQSYVGQDTGYIERQFPATFNYLKKNLSNFEDRKSSIYKGKPPFSIFGIGEYSFKPYKVAISGLYKTYHFTLVLPQNGKPVMLDDTCYFIGFDRIDYAVYSIILLNSEICEDFLHSITFSDAKRVFTKELLMRIDLAMLAKLISHKELEKQICLLNDKYNLEIDTKHWQDFIEEMAPQVAKEMTLF